MPTSVQRRHVTKQQFVYETLRDAILRCEFQPGERLNIGGLAKQLGVSIVPIREALRLLESEGFIVNVAHVGVTIAPIWTTSKFEPLMVFRVLNSSSFQRGSGAPLMNQLEPLSATNIPCFFIARRITCIAGENPEISKACLRRTRMPIGGKLGLVSLLAQWVAGET